MTCALTFTTTLPLALASSDERPLRPTLTWSAWWSHWGGWKIAGCGVLGRTAEAQNRYEDEQTKPPHGTVRVHGRAEMGTTVELRGWPEIVESVGC